MYKNLYHQDEYNFKSTPYKVRGAFVSKRGKLEKEKAEKKAAEKTPEQKLAYVNETIDMLEKEILVKREDLENLKKEYDEMTGKAKEDSENLLAGAQKQAEEIKEEKSKLGYEEGFDKGYYDGLEKGKAETEQKFSSLIKTLQGLVDSALSEKMKIINNTEDDVVDLSIDIAGKVVDQELKTDREIVVNFVKEGIKKLEDKEKIIIYANPQDIELIKSHRGEFRELVDAADTMHILPDELLEQGECRLESKSEIVDTDVDYQFKEIQKKLRPGN